VSLIEVVDGQVELVVRAAGGSSAASVRLFNWARSDGYELAFSVEVMDGGLHALLDSVFVTVWDSMGEFFDGLARDFRGWEGTRVWTNNHLVVTATFGSGGYVCLGWTLRSDVFGNGWEATVSTVVEGGEEMTAVAADMRDFLGQG